LKLKSCISGDGLISIADLCSNEMETNTSEKDAVATLLEKELESSSSCEKDMTVRTPHRTPINSPIKTPYSVAPFSPSSYFINAPLSSSTPRHLRGSPRRRSMAAEKENIEQGTPRLPSIATTLANLAERGMPKKELNLTPKRTVPFVPRTPTPFKRALATLEKRHGTLNSTHDASLEDLSEVLSFIDSPAKRIRPNVSSSSTESSRTQKSARKQLHLDDDGYSSFSAQNMPNELRLRATQSTSALPHWKSAKSAANKMPIKNFHVECDAAAKVEREEEKRRIPLPIHSIKLEKEPDDPNRDDFFVKSREPSPQTWSTIATGSSANQQNLTAKAQAYLESLGDL